MKSSTDAQGSVVLEGIYKEFGTVTALRALDLEVPAGSFFGLLGPSGCGKTTLLRILAGLEKPTGGRVRLDGEDITDSAPESRPFNIVFQRYALFPHLSAADNVAFGLTTERRRRASRAEIDSRVGEMLDLVGLGEYGPRRPEQLSGGQQQRVALARALVRRPKLLLLDEPLAALDRNVRQTLREELLRIHAELGTTFVFVTHDQEEALSMSDRIALMNGGELEQVADPLTLYHRPATLFAARFVGSGTFLAGRALAKGEGRVDVEVGGFRISALDAGVEPGGAVSLLLRPEELEIGTDGGGRLTGVVVTRAFFGTHHELRIETRAGIVHARASVSVEPGTEVEVVVPARAGIAYAAEGADPQAVPGPLATAEAE